MNNSFWDLFDRWEIEISLRTKNICWKLLIDYLSKFSTRIVKSLFIIYYACNKLGNKRQIKYEISALHTDIRDRGKQNSESGSLAYQGLIYTNSAQ